MKAGFIERTLGSLLSASNYAAGAERMAARRGVLQQLDPRVKVAGLFGLVIAVSSVRELRAIVGLFALALLLAVVSRIRLAGLVNFVWAPVLFFTGTIALPALFLTPGRAVVAMAGISITEPGLRSAAFLLSRAETAATFSALLVLTTPWTWVLKALRTFRCPVVLVAVLGMTYRYIFVILRTAFEMFESRKSRTVGVLEARESRRLAASAVGVLLGKSLQLSGDVHLAMQSRGFRGEVHVLHEFRARPRDWWWSAGCALAIVGALWWGQTF